MQHLKFYNKEDVLSLTRIRRFETKIGERLLHVHDPMHLEQSLQQSNADFVVFGIPEDIGVKANGSIGGTDTLWIPFLHAFLNMQSNDFLAGDNILLLGHFDFGDLQYTIENNARNNEERIEAYRHAVTTIDNEVEQLVKLIAAAGKTPIAIGGGHNNAYPLIKGSAKGLHKSGQIPLAQINCINLDAHTDYRPAEGRHSGNAFRYAEEDGYLLKYCVVGVHENYIPQNVWIDIVNNPFIDLITYEDIFVEDKRTFMQAVAHATTFTEDSFTGVELDMDSIEHVLAPAASPSGLSIMHARQYMRYAGIDTKTAYVHICEGAARLSDGRKDDLTGKLCAYLLSDFIKAKMQAL